MDNVERQAEFAQVCLWPGTVVGTDRVEEFVVWMKDNFDVRVQYLEEILTSPDTGPFGEPVPGTGGRNDLLFAVHQDDIGKFAGRRLGVGIRWIEDVLSPVNYQMPIYPERLRDYMSWDPTPVQDDL